MKISVVVALYNGEKYIVSQLESLKKQSVKPDEVILVDDRSKDSTIKIVHEYIINNGLENCWHLYINEKNKGHAKNFIEGVGYTTGDIVLFCDQDDIWNSDKIEKLVNVFYNHEDAYLVVGDVITFDDETGKILKEKKILDGNLEKITFGSHNIFFQYLGSSMCFKKKYFEQIQSYWVAGWLHDEWLWEMAIFNDGAYVLREALMQRRVHANNASIHMKHTKQSRYQQLLCQQNAIEQLKLYVENNDTDDLKKEKIIWLNKYNRATQLRINLLKGKIFESIRLIKYLNYYKRKKGYLLDVLLSIRKNHE